MTADDSAGQSVKKDVFAEIAAQRRAMGEASLVAPGPGVVSDRVLPLKGLDRAALFTATEKLDTPEKLRAELARQREAHVPFLRDLTPTLPEPRLVMPVEAFDWRLQTDADRADFVRVLKGEGAWERVTIPHYGPPLGRATAYYRTSVVLTDAALTKGALFVFFKGVDYKAHVFLNGTFLGSHEDFFAPFEFNATAAARAGENVLLVVVENDAICMGNHSWSKDGTFSEGDKLYAATGPGYDDPEVGWHHCPPGMGIYQAVRFESRACVHIHDLFVRPLSLDGEVEAWIEVWNSETACRDVRLSLSVHGRNFEETAICDLVIDQEGLGPGVNYLRVPLAIPAPRVWSPEEPWLYQLQVHVLDADGDVVDAAGRQFGIRTFRMDETSDPKGRFYLNEREIRLRGANTMGFEQQDVMQGDLEQLVDDILLAKVCHMNFWRLTQRPVQREVYDYCDRLGLMTQTDLPLFGLLRRNQFCEAVRQAEEMERLVRSHPSSILVSYINEPFPDAGGRPHRHLLRDELERFFLAADQAVHQANPDRVIKAVDGDYDPPAPGLPDNHCYCGWYNGHGVDLGKLHKGYWLPIKPGWMFGCGEFGAEGLEDVRLMRSRYPETWLPQSLEEERTWTPDRIVRAQSGRFHYMWYDTQDSLEAWVEASQAHQAWATRIMTEAFRREDRMNTFAIHLFIDAFPAGWMKAIMDSERRPKSAYFAYREALTPLMVNLRTDRLAFFGGETAELEVWVCNDTHDVPERAPLAYRLELDGEAVVGGSLDAHVPTCSSLCQGLLRLPMPAVTERTVATIRLALMDAKDMVLHDTSLDIELFPKPESSRGKGSISMIGANDGKAATLLMNLGLDVRPWAEGDGADTILVEDMERLSRHGEALRKALAEGATVVLLDLPPGEHKIAGGAVTCMACAMDPVHFVSRATGHSLVSGFAPNVFKFWFDAACGHVTPLLDRTFTGEGWAPILTSGNRIDNEWSPALAVAEKREGKGMWRICNLKLADRIEGNPVAEIFVRRLLGVQ